jgi:type IV pilus assembly protein PilF
MPREPGPRRAAGIAARVFAGIALVFCGGLAAKDRAVARLSSDGRENLVYAESFLVAGDRTRALEFARKAQDSDPEAPDVHVFLARLQHATGDERQAGRSFQRALKLAPGSGAVRNAYGAWLCDRDQYDAADAEFKRALRDPGYAMPQQAIANAGLCAHRAGRWLQAESALRHALEFAPQDPQVLFKLADAEFRQGKLLEARAFVERRDALGDDAATLDLAARIEAAAGDRAAESRYRRRLRDGFPDYAPTGEGAAPP